MTRDERIKAYTMWLDGMGWESIGEVLGYSADTIRKDILARESPCRLQNVIYPALKDFIQKSCGGSITAFADLCGLSKSTAYGILNGTAPPSEKSTANILLATGLSEEEAFGK